MIKMETMTTEIKTLADLIGLHLLDHATTITIAVVMPASPGSGQLELSGRDYQTWGDVAEWGTLLDFEPSEYTFDIEANAKINYKNSATILKDPNGQRLAVWMDNIRPFTVSLTELYTANFFGDSEKISDENQPQWIAHMERRAAEDGVKITLSKGGLPSGHVAAIDEPDDDEVAFGDTPEGEWFDRASTEAWKRVNA